MKNDEEALAMAFAILTGIEKDQIVDLVKTDGLMFGDVVDILEEYGITITTEMAEILSKIIINLADRGWRKENG